MYGRALTCKDTYSLVHSGVYISCVNKYYVKKWKIMQYVVFKTDSAQSSSNKCKNCVLKIYLQHIDFLNTIWNFLLKLISPGDPAMKIPSILEKFNVKPRKNASCLSFQLTRNVRVKWNIWNFKFNFLSRGHLESSNLDRIFLPLFKILPCYEAFLVT